MRQRSALRPYIAELEGVRGSLGLPVERDLYFEPTSLQVLMDEHCKARGE